MKVDNTIDKMEKERPVFIRRADIGKKDVMDAMGYDPFKPDKSPPRFKRKRVMSTAITRRAA